MRSHVVTLVIIGLLLMLPIALAEDPPIIPVPKPSDIEAMLAKQYADSFYDIYVIKAAGQQPELVASNVRQGQTATTATPGYQYYVVGYNSGDRSSADLLFTTEPQVATAATSMAVQQGFVSFGGGEPSNFVSVINTPNFAAGTPRTPTSPVGGSGPIVAPPAGAAGPSGPKVEPSPFTLAQLAELAAQAASQPVPQYGVYTKDKDGNPVLFAKLDGPPDKKYLDAHDLKADDVLLGQYELAPDGTLTFKEGLKMQVGADGKVTTAADATLSDGDTAALAEALAKGPAQDPDRPKGILSPLNKVNEFLKQEYPGLAGLGGLLLGGALDDWKKTVDDAFCKTVVLGGPECRIQAICGISPKNAGGDGVLVSQKFDNSTLEIRFIAHVEGERSPATVTPDGVALHLYKVTYAIRNPNRREPNAYQLRFFYEGGSFDWFPDFQPFTGGQYVKFIGDQAIVAYSTKLYTRVCLVFRDTVEVNGDPTRQVCNAFVEYTGGATARYGPGTPTTVQGGAAAGPARAPGTGF